MKVLREKNAPDFLVVGAAKSGTTSLWHYMDQHPGIFVNQGLKELGYFSDHYGISDLDEYLKYFDGASSHELIGEVCHAYLSSPESAKKILDFNPQMKIVMILRNPVERAYSLYNWMVEHGHENSGSFEEALRQEELKVNDQDFIAREEFFYMNYLYFHSGLYFEQVKRYYDLFPAENIFVMVYESFRDNNEKVLKSLFQFLGVKEEVNINLEKKNQSKAIKNKKLHYYLMHDFISTADRLLIPRRIGNRLRRILLNANYENKKPSKMEVDTRTKLFERYHDDINKLSELIDVDLNQYWK